MKKKVAAIVLTSALFVGTVSASSINGEYKGNPIVNLKSNGKLLPVEDTPPIIYEGRTLVPIYMLKQLGANVAWDQETYSVNVEFAKTPINTADSIKKLSDEARTIGGKYFKLIYDALGPYVEVRYDITSDQMKDSINMYQISLLASKTDADEIVVKMFSGDAFIADAIVHKSDVLKWANKEITNEQFDKLWKVEDYKSNKPPVSQPLPSPSSQQGVIESKIDGDFEGFEDGKIFKLTNGQIWEQIDFAYKYTYKFNPKVLIYKDGSNYIMSVEGVDKKVKVKQIK